MRDIDRQAMALAGVFQAASLAESVADSGVANQQVLSASIHSIFKIDADSIEEIYGGTDGIQTGLRCVSESLGGRAANHNLLRYSFNLIALADKFHQRRDLQIAVREGIDATAQQLHFTEATDDIVLARLAQIYYHNISQLKPRIVINGQPDYLKQERVVSQIRAILLSGIRSGLLWKQVGGRKIKLIFGRARLASSARSLLR